MEKVFLSPPSSSPMAAAATVAAATSVGLVLFLRWWKHRHHSPSPAATPHSKPRRLRSTTIGSTKLMCSGLLPKDAPYDSIINIALWYDALPAMADLQGVFRDHMVPYQRFHSVPHQAVDCGPIEWVCQRVEVERHFFTRRAVARATLEAEGFPATGEGAARLEVEELLNTPLTTKREGRPWWEVHVIEAPEGRGGIVLMRIHHVIGDGVSLMEAFADSITDESGQPISKLNLFSPAPRGAQRHVGDGACGARAVVARLVSKPLRAIRLLLSAVSSFLYILGLATIGSDTPCAFQNASRQLPYQPNRFTVYFPSHSLDLIKAIKNEVTRQQAGLADGAVGSDAVRRNITVNDVEFALFAGTIRRFLSRHGEDPNTVHLRALTPFAVMEPVCSVSKYQTLLRNHWTFVVNALPIAAKSAVSRIVASHDSWARLKTTALIPVSFFAHRLNAKLPAAMQKQTSNDLMKRISVVFSNVPGPQTRLFFAGKEVSSVHMLFPNVAQQVGLLSVNGMVHMAVVLSTFHEKGQTRRWLAEAFVEELVEAAAAVGIARMDVLRQVRMI